MAVWFKHRYLVYLQRIQQGGLIGPLCSCTLGIQQNVYDQLPKPQQKEIAEMFRSAEGNWALDGPERGFNSPQTGGKGRPIFPVLLTEIPHIGDRIIKPFAWSDTRGAFCLSKGGTKRLVALPYAGPAERIFKWGGLTRTRKREPTRGIRGHAPPGKFEILFF